MAYEKETNHPAFDYEPLKLIVDEPSSPFAKVNEFDIQTLKVGFKNDFMLPLLSRRITLFDIPGFLNVLGEGAPIPLEIIEEISTNDDVLNRYFETQGWNEKKLPGINTVFELGFSISNEGQWKKLQDYYLALRIGRNIVNLACEASYEEHEILPAIKELGNPVILSSALWNETDDEVDAPFSANALELSFLEVTPHEFEGDDDDEVFQDMPSPSPTSKRPLVLV